MKFEDLLNRLLDEGIEITLRKQDGNVWYDLNVRAKSDLKVRPMEDGELAYVARYSSGALECEFSSVLSKVLACMCGRDFIAGCWQDLLVKEGFLKVVTTVTTTVERA